MLIREPDAKTSAIEAAIDQAIRHDLLVSVHERCHRARSIADERALVLHLSSRSDLAREQGRPFAASTHSSEECARAIAAGAVYALLSPVWAPISKPLDTRPTLGLDELLAAAERHRTETRQTRVLALGGVTAERCRILREEGVGAAVLGAFAAGSAAEITGSVRRYLR